MYSCLFLVQTALNIRMNVLCCLAMDVANNLIMHHTHHEQTKKL